MNKTDTIIIVLPVQERQVFREMSPDLWTIRDLTIETGNWIVRQENMTVSTLAEKMEATPVSQLS